MNLIKVGFLGEGLGDFSSFEIFFVLILLISFLSYEALRMWECFVFFPIVSLLFFFKGEYGRMDGCSRAYP